MTLSQLIYKYTLQHARPVKFVAEILGIISAGYFLWTHNWAWAIIVSVFFFLLSTLLLWGQKIELNSIAQTTLGKIMSPYAKLPGFILYNLSALPFVYGFWSHQVLYIFVAIVVLLLPHAWDYVAMSSEDRV